MITIFYQFVQDIDYDNVAIYINGKLAVDNNDYINLETGMYVLRALGIEFQYESYSFSSDHFPEWKNFPDQLSKMQHMLRLNGEKEYDLNESIL